MELVGSMNVEKVTIEDLQKVMQKKKYLINENDIFEERLKQPLSYRYEWAMKQIPAGVKTVADVGCGIGFLAYLLNRTGYLVTAIDNIQANLNEVERITKREVTTKLIDMSIPYTENTKYDIVIALEILEHIQDDRLFINNLYNMLTSNGTLILSTPIDKLLDCSEHVHIYNIYDILSIMKRNFSQFKVCKLNKFQKYSRPKNIFGIVAKKGE